MVSVETELEKKRLSPQYRRCFKIGLQHFRLWLAKTLQCHWDTPPASHVINAVLAQYVNQCEHDGTQIWIPKHSVLAIQTWVPRLRGHLQRPWVCLRQWISELYLGSRPALQQEILFGLFGVALDSAFLSPSHRHHWICFAVLVRVGFFGLLRPGELLALRAQDVLF